MTKILTPDNIRLNAEVLNKKEAIQLAGQLLVDNSYVHSSYIDEMFERESSVSTFMGNGVAIPHGTEEAKKHVDHSGISILTVPDGVDFGDGQIAKLIIGIAGKGNEHLEILQKIALVVADEEKVNQMIQASTADELLSFFEGVA